MEELPRSSVRGARIAFAQRWLAIITVVALVCAVGAALLPRAAWAGEVADTSWYKIGEDTYILSDAPDLLGLSELVRSGEDFAGKTVAFDSSESQTGKTVSLSVLAGEWQPIGTASHPFCGTFDGKGLTVVDMSLTSGTDGVGLFGYTGEGSLIENVAVAGTIALEVNAVDARVSNVGGVVGSTKGSLSNCRSSVVVSIVSHAQSTPEDNVTVGRVGCVAGYAEGDVRDCSTSALASVCVESSAGSPSADITWVAGFVGGIVGQHGYLPESDEKDDLATLTKPASITGCTNAAKVRISTYTQGAKDRFDWVTYASARYLGGIVGYTTGNVSDCVNTGTVDSAQYDEKGAPKESFGCTTTAGIVGGLRSDIDNVSAFETETDPGMKCHKATDGEPLITVQNCSNTAKVIGLAQVGGIVGEAGSFTNITRCANEGTIEASRFNKPAPGGITGSTQGDISYCYNTGDVVSTTGGGYYAAGIAGFFDSPGSDIDGNAITPEMYACYNAGHMLTESSAYKSGSLVGDMSGGYIHHCFSLENCANTGLFCGDTTYTGTIASSVKHVAEKQLTAATSVALLNACCDKDGWQVYYALPEGATWGDRDVHPVLVGEPSGSARDLAGLSGAKVETASDARYSSFMDPVPAVAVSAGGVDLVQNADFRVVAQAGTAGKPAGTSGLTATIAGIGNYRGELSAKATYAIGKGDLSSCTVSAEPSYFNYEKQKPASVSVFDEAGNELDTSEYTWSVDEKSFADTSENAAGRPYVDARSEGYPITVTATATGNYTGSKTDNCFKIKTVPFAASKGSEDVPQIKIGKVRWNKQSWDFEQVGSYVANGGKGDDTKKGVMKVTYTGSPITPTIEGITYLGQPLKEITADDKYYENPFLWGYRLLYGNPNPETGSTDEASSYLENVTNATAPGEYAVMTIRSAPMSNFDNYITVWYTIEPANIASATVSLSKTKYTYDGKAKKPSVTVKFNGKTLKAGTDYTLSYSAGRKGAGTYKVTVKGKGNFKGSVSKTFTIVKAKNTLKAMGKTATVSATKTKKSAQKVSRSKAIGVSGAKGTLACKKVSGSSKVSVAQNGTITVKKGTPRGTYTAKVKVSAAGSANYKAAAKTVTVKVKVK